MAMLLFELLQLLKPLVPHVVPGEEDTQLVQSTGPFLVKSVLLKQELLVAKPIPETLPLWTTGNPYMAMLVFEGLELVQHAVPRGILAMLPVKAYFIQLYFSHSLELSISVFVASIQKANVSIV